jgi:hypothetical protein
MGWNSYDSFGSSVTENETLQAAQAQQTTLLSAGFRYVVVDYLWFDSEDAVDANGRFLPSTSRFPSATGSSGFTSLASRVHALGLQFGIHIMRGIPRKSVSANTPIANSTYHASDAANTSDACPWDNHMWGVRGNTAAGQAWYDSIFAQYAAWGVDFVKVDDTLNPDVAPPVYHQSEVDAIRAAIEKSGRSIVLSLSPGPMQPANAGDLEATANQWRMVNDFWDKNGLSTLSDVFNAAGTWQGVTGLSPGHWPDADMLPLGYLGPRCPVHASGPTALSHNQQVTVMTLWGILPSPLIFGGNEPMLSSDAWSTALLTNEEVIAVNQDAAGVEAKVVSRAGTEQIWSRDLSGGRKAVAFFNAGTQDATMSTTLASLGVPAQATARDAWNRADVTVVGGTLSANVPYTAAALFVLTPPQTESTDAGAGDATIDGSGADARDASGGGADGASDSSAVGSGASSSSSGAFGSSTGAHGTASSSTGTTGHASAETSDGASQGGSPGCACRLAAGRGADNTSALGALASLLAISVTRRRPSPRPRAPTNSRALSRGR